MFVAVNNVGYPANQQVLADLRQTRTELAHLLGYRSWADYDVADHMAGTVQRVESFLSTIDEGTKKPAEAEYQQLLKRKQQDVPAATSLDAWEADYYTELVRQESTPAGEPFRLPYAAAEAGILRVAGRLFGLSLEPVTVLVWDPSVKTLVIRRNGVTLGVVYLDMYVRPNKRNRGAGTVMLRSGNGQQLPEVALIAGFGGDASTQSSLTHAELRTFFHELGHVIHFVVGGRHRWSGLDSIHAERDFLEAPSQMLESWMWDPATIALLMGGSERPAGGPRLDLSRAQQTAQFGEGLRERNLLFRSRLALQLHVGDPATSADEVTQTTYERSLPFRIVPDTHHWAGFTHLANPNYTSSYYTYLWSLAVARDLESTFDHADLLATAPAERYRRMIVEVGASQPASQMLERFLGRPFSATAWLESLHPPR
jgi:thimet oligopeptidase